MEMSQPKLLRFQILKLNFDAMNLGDRKIDLVLRQEIEVKRNADLEEKTVLVMSSVELHASEEGIFQFDLIAAAILAFETALPQELGEEIKDACRQVINKVIVDKVEKLSAGMGFVPIRLDL